MEIETLTIKTILTLLTSEKEKELFNYIIAKTHIYSIIVFDKTPSYDYVYIGDHFDINENIIDSSHTTLEGSLKRLENLLIQDNDGFLICRTNVYGYCEDCKEEIKNSFNTSDRRRPIWSVKDVIYHFKEFKH